MEKLKSGEIPLCPGISVLIGESGRKIQFNCDCFSIMLRVSPNFPCPDFCSLPPESIIALADRVAINLAQQEEDSD